MAIARNGVRAAAVGALAMSLLASVVMTAEATSAAVTSSSERRVASVLPPSPADPAQPITDQVLAAAITAATTNRALHDERIPVVAVEVLTAYTADLAATVHSLGGAVTGTVAGQIVQAEMPAGHVDDLALAAGVSYVRSPQLVTRAEALRTEIGTGPTVGQNVGLTNAAAWQATGITGAVKIGVIDYFNFGLWRPAEEGPLPDAAHRFCLDTGVDSDNVCADSHNSPNNNNDGYEHGVAVAQVIKDIAPGAELYVATTGTTTDLQAAIDFFANNGVHIVTRSLGAAYDGAGDGTGPLATVVDYAASRGITWFNSAGNDALDGYARLIVPNDLSASGGYVDFDNGPGVDTLLRISGCALFDGVRWSDWNLAPRDRTDYTVELWQPTNNPDAAGHDENYNPDSLYSIPVTDHNQSAGAVPLELADAYPCGVNHYGADGGIIYLSIRRRGGTSTVGPPDTIEIGLGGGYIEANRSQAPYSADRPVVDSANPALVAVGAVDPADGSGLPDALGKYSSQGPTNDGRIKPDISAPSCVTNTIYAPNCFNGTSAASPVAAGEAALLLESGIAITGAPLAAAVKHFVLDRPFTANGPPDGPDNKYGTGQILLPNPPTSRIPPAAAVGAPAMSAYHQVVPTRIVDTRPSSLVGTTVGTLPKQSIVDVSVTAVGVPGDASAVALNLTTTDTLSDGYVQAVPYMRSTYGTSSTLNVAGPGTIKANFAIVPIGMDGKISVYLPPGGNLIVDLLGYFEPTGSQAASAGRFVAIDPVRTLDTRTSNLVPSGWAAHEPSNESVVVPSSSFVPSGVSALVLNVTSTLSRAPGFLRAQPTGTVPTSSTVNFTANVDAANTAIVPVGPDGTVSIYTNTASHIVVDITGYITGAAAPVAATGLFVAVPTGRAYDSRTPPGTPVATSTARAIQLTGLAAPLPLVPTGASAISINLTAVDAVAPGFLTAFPAGGALPATSSLNYVAGQPIANGALVKLGSIGGLSIFANAQSSVVIDINGYFT